MKRLAFLLALLLLLLPLAACAEEGSGVVQVPSAGIIPDPDSNMFKDPPPSDTGSVDDDLTYGDPEQDSMAGNAPIYLPTVPVDQSKNETSK